MHMYVYLYLYEGKPYFFQWHAHVYELNIYNFCIYLQENKFHGGVSIWSICKYFMQQVEDLVWSQTKFIRRENKKNPFSDCSFFLFCFFSSLFCHRISRGRLHRYFLIFSGVIDQHYQYQYQPKLASYQKPEKVPFAPSPSYDEVHQWFINSFPLFIAWMIYKCIYQSAKNSNCNIYYCWLVLHLSSLWF